MTNPDESTVDEEVVCASERESVAKMTTNVLKAMLSN